MVPPWVPPLPAAPPGGEDGDGDANANPAPSSSNQAIPVAPARRFIGTSRNFGDYARTGDGTSMRRGLGQYVRKGYGGTSTATRRMGGTIQTAQALYSALAGEPQPSGEAVPSANRALWSGRSADEIVDALVEAVRPVDGTQDAEASRTSIKEALSEVLVQFPDADLLNLEQEQREFVIERFVAADIFHRVDLDVGRTIREKAPDARAGLRRLKEVRDYIRQTVAASFRKIQQGGQRHSSRQISQMVQAAIHETFQVFEGYL